MLNKELLLEELRQLPLYACGFLDSQALEFTWRVRWICEHECPQYGKSWACPPGVGSVESCESRCKAYQNCLMIATVTEVEDISDIEACLLTRGPHEELTDQVGDLLRQQGVEPYILSTESCAACSRCSILDEQPCRHPERMHPCVESHGINLLPVIEEQGLAFQYGENIVTWFSLLFF